MLVFHVIHILFSFRLLETSVYAVNKVSFTSPFKINYWINDPKYSEDEVFLIKYKDMLCEWLMKPAKVYILTVISIKY